ncbi:sigma-70 family RNA polymerase sigma factor [Nocardia otitidiscaviarum]|uniref:Sigma-70 family RNA polymerase sigma factor n=1 Tax=Nocardia otitidiscaviarum TaxID=1823 RepID=A0A516NR68_9NOCA|nr:sigma-70 family RNA polymerase sigma factor [Nocardia otitidiscaviarum]MBF6181626.1 sigma-70 family RNA polymerase sigma factor [Nocardia otitidiscaviarum]MCP9625321.1 sigma-70 family RNA polymerase sigma factor [Nocardia otitidiscaviarum]QDP81410.1 sigma-70 family RNA polymerase sigma factor [Nocardia otitidiscaviarum]
MRDEQFLAEKFDEHRTHLRSVAYRMLGSLTDADDAIQEAWLRLARTDASDIGNLGGWLTTVVGRVCLDMLRSRKSRHEQPLEAEHLPDPVVLADAAVDPEQQALLADSVGLGLLIVLETLSPAERLAFVLHDMFAVPYEQIAPIVGRTPQTAKKLASQARRRVQGSVPTPDPDRSRQRRVVDAFLAAARQGDFDELLRILDPGVVLRADSADALRVIHGATAVAGMAATFQRMTAACTVHPAIVNGGAGLVNTLDGKPFSIMNFTVVGDRIAAIDLISDRDRLSRLDLTAVVG